MSLVGITSLPLNSLYIAEGRTEVIMKKFLIASLLVLPVVAQADNWVNGYQKKDGTYVQGYMKSDSDNYRSNNYSSQGNTNPYTGERGYQRNEYSNPPAYNSGGSRSKSPCYGIYCD